MEILATDVTQFWVPFITLGWTKRHSDARVITLASATDCLQIIDGLVSSRGESLLHTTVSVRVIYSRWLKSLGSPFYDLVLLLHDE